MNHDLPWQRSRYCSDSSCVEVAVVGDAVFVRNSSSAADVARFTIEEWRIFLKGALDGQFQA